MSDPKIPMEHAPVARRLPPPGSTPPTSLSPDQVARARKSAQEFEAMAIGQFLAPMFNTVDPSKSLFGGGDGEATWRPMLTEEIAKQITAAGGIGIANSVLQEMLRAQEQRKRP
jgi:Rod binding domain-containing protein